ncbi:hypothetical protein BKA65DRAFT_2884 [Rhexocercosporidium sp. MPI-PUGE-AT-0058]|nr:hypothetical protein BKA65DRAFT_2884 [Rhexocercosporidium sp. MPI-PUGE-AT-0058]
MASTSPQSHIPCYKIARRADPSLQFDPPAGSIELANALSLRFPLEASLEDQMRRAILLFHDSDQLNPKSLQLGYVQYSMAVPVLAESSSSPNLPDSTIASEAPSYSTTPQKIISGKSAEPKRRKMRYDTSKRTKVAAVRKRDACPFHKAKKIECTCFTNKSPANDNNAERSNDDVQIASRNTFSSEDLAAETSSFQEPTTANLQDFEGTYDSFFGLDFNPCHSFNDMETMSMSQTSPDIDFDNSWFSSQESPNF